MIFPLEMRSQRAAVEENPNPVIYERIRDEMPALKLAPTAGSQVLCTAGEGWSPPEQLFVTIPFCRTPTRLAGCLSTRDFCGLIHLWAQPSPFPGCRESSFISTQAGKGLEGEVFEEGMSYPEPLDAPLL